MHQIVIGLVVLFLSSAIFGLAYVHWPLFTENQHTKYLHGLAQSGYGHLITDWLANTVDPLPAFTVLVFLNNLFLNSYFYLVYQSLLLGIYLVSLYGVAARLFPLGRTWVGPLVFAAIIVAIHSTLLAPFNMRVVGTSLGWLLQSGVAGQYMFNPVFQPAAFGALLILSIFLFLSDRPRWASASAALAAVFHPAYMLSAGLLVACYSSIILWLRRDWLSAFVTGAVGLAVVTPMLVYTYAFLRPTSPEAWARAQDIIVNFRIPYHSLPEHWVDDAVYARLGWIVVAMFLVRRTRLLPIMLVPLLVGVALTAAQWYLDSDSLAFMAPWRVSVFLVPLSTGLIVGFVVAWVFDRAYGVVQRFQLIIALLMMVWLGLVAARGMQATLGGFRDRQQEPTMSMMRFVASQVAAGENYLVPSMLEGFRLTTGAPVVITHRSHPYKDVEVMEWYDRLQAVDAFYAAPDCDKLGAIVTTYNVTHLVLPAEQPAPRCEFGVTNVYQDDAYGVWRIGH